MKSRQRYFFYAVLAGALGLAACGKSEAPPSPKAAAPVAPAAPAAPAVDAELKRLAAEVYVFGFPMVLTDVTREVQTADRPVNEFDHSEKLPDASTTDVRYPNADFLYSQAWLDLSHGPVILSVPDTRGRYYLIAMLDAWTNVAHSLGKRTSGTEKREFALVGPRWKGTLPEGVTQIKSPTELAWLFGRVNIDDKADMKAAIKVQNQFELESAADRGKRGKRGKRDTKAAAPAATASNVDTKTAPRDQVANMSAAAFYSRLARLLPGNPPAKDDAPMLAKMSKLGIVAGEPFDTGKLDPVAIRSIDAGMKSARDAITSAAKGSGSGDIRHGWRVDRALGRWGTEYGRRAVAAWNGLGVNAPEDAIFLSTYLDAGGRKLDAANRYVLHFDKGQLPPADGFWSLSLYNDDGHFVANELSRNHLDSGDPMKRNADGSLDIYLQNADPGKDAQANWLPAPKEGGFNVILRIYWPKQQAIDGHWNPPGIKPAA